MVFKRPKNASYSCLTAMSTDIISITILKPLTHHFCFCRNNTAKALRAIHGAFSLSARPIALAIVGGGRVGQELVKQIAHARYVTFISSSSYVYFLTSHTEHELVCAFWLISCLDHMNSWQGTHNRGDAHWPPRLRGSWLWPSSYWGAVHRRSVSSYISLWT